jgi:multimeric flavodoxin WrbA
MNGGMLRGKVGAAVAAVRRSGGVPTFNQLCNYLNYSEMMMPSSNYWNVIHGTVPGDALQDAEGVQIMEVLGKNMATMLKQREATKEISAENPREKKKYTHFIR